MRPSKRESYNEEYYELDNLYNEVEDRCHVVIDSSIWYN